MIDLARAVTALGLADPPAIVSGTTARFIDVLVPDAGLAARLKDPRTARAAGAELRRLDPVVAGLIEPLFGATLTPTVLAAGKAVNVIPTHAEALRRLPHPARDDPRATCKQYVATPSRPARHRVGVRVDRRHRRPTPRPRPRRSARASRACCAGTCRSAVLAPMTSGSFTDSRWVREAFPDCVAYGFAPFLAESFHAMDGGRDHEPDERILVEDVDLPGALLRAARAGPARVTPLPVRPDRPARPLPRRAARPRRRRGPGRAGRVPHRRAGRGEVRRHHRDDRRRRVRGGAGRDHRRHAR